MGPGRERQARARRRRPGQRRRRKAAGKSAARQEGKARRPVARRKPNGRQEGKSGDSDWVAQASQLSGRGGRKADRRGASHGEGQESRAGHAGSRRAGSWSPKDGHESCSPKRKLRDEARWLSRQRRHLRLRIGGWNRRRSRERKRETQVGRWRRNGAPEAPLPMIARFFK